MHADDAAALFQHAFGLGLQNEAERRKALGLVAQEIEELPLRHHRDEAATRAQPPEIRHIRGLLSDLHVDVVGLVVRPLQEGFKQPQFVQHFQRGRVHRVAAEVAQEIRVLLEHDHGHAGAREQ
jgi:hypothetical protein